MHEAHDLMLPSAELCASCFFEGPQDGAGPRAVHLGSPGRYWRCEMPPTRGGPAASSRSRSLLFCGAAVVCYVMYSTLHASSASYEAKAPVTYRPHSVPGMWPIYAGESVDPIFTTVPVCWTDWSGPPTAAYEAQVENAAAC